MLDFESSNALKKMEREDGRNGKEDSMNDVSRVDSHVNVDVQTERDW